MYNKISQNKLLRDKCILSLRFIAGTKSATLKKTDLMNSELCINEACEKEDFEYLRTLDRQLANQIRMMPIRTGLEIIVLLQEKLGIDFIQESKIRLDKIEQVFSKGSISGYEEFVLLLDRKEEIQNDCERAVELNYIRRLIEKYSRSSLV